MFKYNFANYSVSPFMFLNFFKIAIQNENQSRKSTFHFLQKTNNR